MKRLWLVRLGLLITPVAVAAAAFEVVLRGVVPRSGVTPFRTSEDPGLPHQLRPSFQTLYKGVEVRTNARGFRGPEWPEKDPVRPRVVLVGDSITFGNGIPFEDTMAVHLERELGGSAEVIACAVPGYNAPNVARLVEMEVPSLRPDLVVYVFVAGDVAESRPPQPIPPDAVIDELHGFPLGSALLQWLGVRVKGLLRAAGIGADTGWVAITVREFEDGGGERVENSIARMRRVCDENGAALHVAAFPFLIRRSLNPFVPVDEACESICRELHVPFTDLAQAFGEDENLRDYWCNPFDSHPSGEACRIAMRHLAGALAFQLGRRSPSGS